MIPSVDVHLDLAGREVRAGTAHFNLRRGRLSASFSYDERYLADPEAYAIDPTMPITSKTHHTDGLPGAFRDSAPDRWGRSLIVKQCRFLAEKEGSPLRTLDNVDFLLGVFDLTRQGALRFRTPENGEPLSPTSHIPPVKRLPELLRASRAIVQDENGLDEVKALLDAGSGSLGGARPKASVVDGDRLLFAKFSHPGDEWDVMVWEKTALDLARLAGIRTPRARILSIGNEKTLLLERFDRQGSLTNGERLPYLSAMSLLGAEDGSDHDYAEIAEALSVFVGDVPANLLDLFKRVVFSIALHNVDDHVRNLGFIREGGSWSLAPLFDVNPDPHADAPRATSIMGCIAADEARGLAAMLPEFELNEDRARTIIRSMLNALAHWRVIAKGNGCKDAELRLFAPVISDRIEALKRAFGL